MAFLPNFLTSPALAIAHPPWQASDRNTETAEKSGTELRECHLNPIVKGIADTRLILTLG